MRSVYRVLKPGGVTRFVTSALERLANRLINPQPSHQREIDLFAEAFEGSSIAARYPNFTPVDYINIAFRELGGRQYLYTVEDLRQKLTETGFTGIVETDANEVFSPIFEDGMGHGRLLGYEMNSLNAFGIEATK